MRITNRKNFCLRFKKRELKNDEKLNKKNSRVKIKLNAKISLFRQKILVFVFKKRS